MVGGRSARRQPVAWNGHLERQDLWRMLNREIAKQTLTIIRDGGYESPEGSRVVIREHAETAVAGIRAVAPAEIGQLLAAPSRAGVRPAIEVTGKVTHEAAQRLAPDEDRGNVALLNFASAKNVAGGFLAGARAQEEELARASALYPCLLTATNYYASNRACHHLVYTDHMIVSPRVPVFRGPSQSLLPQPFLATVISAPAPNALALERPWPEKNAGLDYEAVLRRRAGMVLALAAYAGCRQLVLGAWGCGVFRNDPRLVADAFGCWLEHDHFAGAFERVVFAIAGRSGGNRSAFEVRFTA